MRHTITLSRAALLILALSTTLLARPSVLTPSTFFSALFAPQPLAGETNLALGKVATQSTTGWDSPASLAVDGNTDGDWFHGSVSHTNGDPQGWWQVDLGSAQQVGKVDVYLMTVCCSSHQNFDVKVSTDGTNWQSFYVPGPVDYVSVPVNLQARYVRVQLRDTNYLALAEVQVLAAPAGPVGHWKFDEASGTTAADSSGGGKTGTLQNGAGWGAGLPGSSVALDGTDDYVQVGSQSSLAVSGALTVSAWIYPTGATASGGIIVNKEGEYELGRFPDGSIQWAVANQSPGWAWVNTGLVAPLNQWTHVTFTYDGVNGKTYANGQLVHTAAASGAIGDADTVNNDLRIGGRQVTPQHFQGRIDEVRIYGRALSQTEVISVITPTVTVTANDPTASETGPDAGQFTVTRTGPTDAALSVNLGVSGTATAGSDYTALPATVTIPAGATSATVQVSPADDSTIESDETVVLSVNAGTSYSVRTPSSATVVIADNDFNPTSTSITITNPANGANFVAPSSIAIDALAASGGNPISKVEFFASGTKLGEDATAPYSFNWANAAAGSYTLTAKATTESSAFTQLPVANSGFESPSLGNSFQYNPTNGTWTIQNGAGISGNGSGFTAGNPAAPEGTQVALLQNAGSYFSQQLSGFQANTNYSVRFSAAQRGNCCNAGGQDFDVYLDATLLGTFKPAGTGYTSMASVFFQTTAGTHTLKFVGRNTAGGENTAFIDDVRVLGAPRQALLVVGATPLSVDDVALKARLEGLGFTVPVVDATASAATDAVGKGLVVISETCASASVNSKFRDVSVPVLVMEMQVYDDMQMTGPTLGTDYSSEGGHSQVIINTPSNPLAAGLTGTVTVTTTPINFGWGRPSVSAARVATMANDGTKFAVFGYETGSMMNGLAAPARRVGLFPMGTTPSVLNSNGWALFDAAVRWTANITTTSVTTTSAPVNITVSKPTVTVTATDATASEAGPDAGQFTVSRTGGTGAPLTVQFSVGGTATSGSDYAALGTSVTIPAGADSAVVQVSPSDDASVETGGESVTLTLVADSAYTVGLPSGATVQIADNDTYPPTVSLTAPANGTSYTSPANVTLTASASDSDGTVAKVEFFQGATKLGEDMTAPYSYTWSNAPAGSYSLTARAIDNSGAQTTSAAVNITAALPNVMVTATDASASEAGPDAGTFTVSRTGGTVSALTVSYTVGGTATSGSDYVALSGSVTIPAGASSQTVTVTPVDDTAVEASETVTLTLASGAAYTTGAPASATILITSNDFNPPTVSLTSPSFNAVFNWPASVTLTANASTSNPNGSISKVEFFQNNIKLGEDTTAPYSFVWSGAPAAFYQLKAKATDNLGLTTTSNVVNITVYAPPSVSIQSPAALSAFTAPASITVNANVTDPMGDLAWVTFSANGVQIGQDSTAPYSIAWNDVPAGTYNLVATAVDGGGSTFDSSVVSITVGSAPVVEVRSPEAGAAFTAPASITIEADTFSSIGLSKVEFFQNGVKLGEDTSAPYSFAWANVAAGTYSLTAKATDQNGAATTSYPVGITVSNNAPPTTQLTSPAGNATFGQGSQITLGADAADGDGSVTKVEFFADGAKLGEDTTAPYSFVWTGAAAGSHSLTAVATDNLGATGTSAAVTINVATFDFPGARLDPSNRTGTEGIDLYSRNFNWSLPLVSLPGRSGLDLGLSLSYNSLVWTKSGNHVLFDGDGGWPSPGFRLGFPIVQGQFYDTQAQKAAYMLVTPSGARVSLRYVSQTATTTTYEAGDSSYLQLTEESGALTLVATDGTRMKYEPRGGVYKCTEVKDRHGNFITVAYNAAGNLQTVTDTLGRVINFGYDAQGYPENITQTWHREEEVGGTVQTVTETHYWARFAYDNQTLDINFNQGLTPLGAGDGQNIRVLKRVTLPDDSYVVFNYTTWGQAYQVSNYAKDNGLLSYVKLGLPLDAALAQGDCPRPTERRDWAAYANGDTNRVGAAEEESVTTYDVADGVTWQNPESNLPETGRQTIVGSPDGTVYREYARTAGWSKGLVCMSEFKSGGKLKKRTSTTWTQDDENLPYMQNPRVKEANVYDFNASEAVRGRRRTTFDYAAFGLPSDVREYDETAATVLRRTHTIYEPASVEAEGVYTKKRIIGLPAQREVWEGEQAALLSKLTYDYDEPGEFLAAPEGNPTEVVQHDPAYIGVGGATRGNLTGVRRWDVADSGNPSKSVVTRTGYNTLGSVVFTRDALGHQVSVSYADSDGGGRLAYLTTTTDADGFTASTWYNYDMGVVTKSETPKPNEAGDEPGPVVTRFYDAVGRALKVVRGANGSYTSWKYGASALYVKQSTIVDDNYPETFILTVSDGVGRPRGTLRKLTGGTGGAYSAQRFSYDRIGREVYVYNPIKVSADAADEANVAAWQPAAEDAPANGGTGWVYTEKEYDWMGRVTREISPAVGTVGTTDRLIDYEGCGCAGRAVVTMMGELVPTNDSSAPAEARRMERTYHDALGRPVKTEALNWNGSVYSSTTTKYDALDRVVRVRQYAGAIQEEPAGEGSTYKTTSMTYDGHGRLETVRRPEYEAGKVATYTYNDDDTPASMSDARGAIATYSYLGNNRHKVTGITYSAPSGITIPPAATYTYDAAGNRSSMATADGGEVVYNYHPTSQLASEARKFPGLGGTYTLTYQYALSGALKSVTDQTAGTSFAYTFDSAGRTTEVTSNGLGATAPLASGTQYRAWGAVQSVAYGDTTSTTVGFDGRGRVTSFALTGVKDSPTGPTRTDGGSFQYYADGALKFASDNRSAALYSSIHDRAFSYDHAGRMKSALSGAEARAFVNGTGPSASGPYSHAFSYDAWGNRTAQNWRYWTEQNSSSDAYDPATGLHGTPWEYDADGRLVSKNEESPNELPFVPARYGYDAAGRLFQKSQTTSRQVVSGGAVIMTAITTVDTFDADGVGVKRATIRKINANQPTTQMVYYLRSSVLGGRTITEYNTSGARKTSYAWAGGEVLAQQTGVDSGTPKLKWQHINPVTGDGRETDSSGALLALTYIDPDGVNVGVTEPFTLSDGDPTVRGLSGGSPINARVSEIMASYDDMNCSIDGILSSCRMARSMMSSGAAVQCPENDCGPRGIYSNSLGRYVGIAMWNPNAAAAGVGISSTNGTIVRNSSNAGWITAGINFVGNGITGAGWTGGTEFVSLNSLPSESGAYLVDVRGGGTYAAPQGNRFTDCFTSSGLNSVEFQNFNAAAADLINQISAHEGVAQTLLAITWRYENQYNMTPDANTNKQPQDPSRWDVGPFHINVYWTDREVKAGNVNFNGLTRTGVYGYRITGGEYGDHTYLGFATPGKFDGDPLSNGRMAARRLNAFGGSDENKAMQYAPADHFEYDSKQKKNVWRPTRTGRRDLYRAHSPAMNRFFDCYNR